MATPQTSTSSASQPPSLPPKTVLTNQNGRLVRPPNAKPSTAANKQSCDVKPVSFRVFHDRTRPAKAWIHIPHNYQREQTEDYEKTAAILLSGADGGVVGPSEMYPSLADRVANTDEGIPVLRLNYRYTARIQYCVADVKAAMKCLEDNFGVSRFVLVGWSFGGALVSALGGSDERVVACAMLASQRAETSGVRTMAPRPLLLVHGTSDQTMRYSASQELYEEYGEKGERKLKLFDGDDHKMSKHARKVEKLLCRFIVKHVGEGEGMDVKKEMVDDRSAEMMKKGGKLLKGRESVAQSNIR